MTKLNQDARDDREGDRRMIDYDITPAELRRRYEAGATTTVLAAETGLACSTVWLRAKAAGTEMRPKGPPPGSIISASTVAKLAELRAVEPLAPGVMTDCARRWGVTVQAVSDLCNRYGIRREWE